MTPDKPLFIDPNINETREMILLYHDDINPDFYPHYHPYYEFTFITKGVMNLIVGERAYHLHAGDCLILRPNDIHTKIIPDACRHIVLIFFEQTLADLFDYLGKPELKVTFDKWPYPPVATLNLQEKQELETKIYKLNLIPLENRDQIHMRLRILLLELVADHFIRLISPTDAEADIPVWLNNYLSQLSVKEHLDKGTPFIYDIIPMSKAQICRVFKKHLHMTPTEYVNYLRLNYAANLLAAGDKEVLEISDEAGFRSLSHFYHLFKKQFGITPQQFRSKNKLI